MNCSDGSILPLVPFLFDHCIDFKTFLAQPPVSSKLPPKNLIFSGQFVFITTVPAETTILLKIAPPANRVPVIVSLTLDSNSPFNRFDQTR